jgi:MFS family permease
LHRTFSSLSHRDFRLFLSGLLIAATGAWIQRIAQDWLVLDLTDSPAAVGVTTAYQFLPTLALGMAGGVLADRFPRRTVLLVTQVSMAASAATLAALALTGRVQVWHVYALALAMGIATAIDNPTRQSLLGELVGPGELRNAIGLVSCTFQVGALVGPLLGGLMMSTVGAGYAFAVNAACYAGPITALALLRCGRTAGGTVSRRERAVREGWGYARSHGTVLWPTVLAGAFGFFTISLPVTLAAFARSEFHSGPQGLGLLSSMAALGSVAGAMSTARRRRPTRLRTVAGIAGVLSGAQVLAAAAPTEAALAVLLVAVGAANLALLTSAQAMIQLGTPSELRGRVIGLYMLVFIGCGALGGPVVGLLAEHAGARTSLLVAGLLPAVATTAVAAHLGRAGGLRLGMRQTRWHLPRAVVVPRALP